MYKLISFSLFLFLVRGDCRSQPVEYALSRIPVMDSLTKALDNHQGYRVSKILMGGTGDSVCGQGAYQGVAYYNNKLQEVSKLNIHPTFGKEVIVIYCIKDSVLKVSFDDTAYYRIGGHYYNRRGDQVVYPEVIEKLDNLCAMLKLTCKLFQ